MEFNLLEAIPAYELNMLYVYFVLKAMDFISGLLKAWKNNNYRSRKMREGIIRLLAEFVGIILCVTIDLIMNLNFYLTLLVFVSYITKEVLSILENLTECGVDLPIQIKEKLEIFNSREDEKNE